MTKTPLRAILARANTGEIPNEALRPKPAQCDTTRRALFGFVGLAGVTAAMPAVVVASMQPAPTGVYADYLAAVGRFNNLPDSLESYDEPAFLREEAVYHHALDQLVAAKPANLQEFAVWFEALSNGDWWADRSLEIIRDLASKEGR